VTGKRLFFNSIKGFKAAPRTKPRSAKEKIKLWRSKRMERTILLVEDSDEDYDAFCRVFKNTNPIKDKVRILRCARGDEALDYLHRRGRFSEPAPAPLPAFILLDLNLPGTDGRTVLIRIKGDKRLHLIPIIVFTTSSNPHDVQDCYANGASSYLVKDTDYQNFKRSVRLLAEYWLTVNTHPLLPKVQI
jgi:CheY-like chemotaxis protein